jgi:hypothetical protein
MRRLRRHRFSPVRFVSAYDATGRGARQTMMNSEVTRGSTNDGPLDASFRLCRNGCKRQSEADCSNTEHGSHARHNGTSRYLPYLNSGNLAWFHKRARLMVVPASVGWGCEQPGPARSRTPGVLGTTRALTLSTRNKTNSYLVHRFHEIDRVGLPVISYESCLSCGQHSDLSGPSI